MLPKRASRARNSSPSTSKRSVTSPSACLAATAAAKPSPKAMVSPGFTRLPPLTKARQAPPPTSRWSVTSTRAAPRMPTSRAGMTRVSLQTSKSLGRSRSGRSRMARSASAGPMTSRRAAVAGSIGWSAISCRGSSKSKSSTRMAQRCSGIRARREADGGGAAPFALRDGRSSGLLRVRCSYCPHPEERPKGASRRANGDAARSRLPPCARDVAQDRGFLLLLVEAVPDEVADADQAAELAGLHHRQVAHAMRGHHLHDLVDAVGGRAGGDVRRHQLMHLVGECLGAVAGEGVDDVALGEHADELAPAVDRDERADALVVELADRRLDAGDRAGARDGPAFVIQDLRDRHRATPWQKRNGYE